LKLTSKLGIASLFGVLMLATLTSMTMVKATSGDNAFAVSTNQSWTWKVTKCVWDSSTTPKFVGMGATITITSVTNTTSLSSIQGNVSLFKADGSTVETLTNVPLGSVSPTNASILAVYGNSSNFVLPVIFPLPLDQTFAAFAKSINTTLDMLKAQYGSQIPFTISKNYTLNAAQLSASRSTLSITFYISGGVSGYTVTNQPVELALTVDGQGVVMDYTATAKNVSIGGGVTVDVVLFEIATAGNESTSLPGYSELPLFIGMIAAIGIVAVMIKRRK